MSTRGYTRSPYQHKRGIYKGKYEVEYIHNLVLMHIQYPKGYQIELDGDLIGLSSNRIRNFALNGPTCVSCGRAGDHYIKEKSHASDRFHLNLYHTHPNGNFVLMTQDHIVPKSKGGSKGLDNLQVMCRPCNQKKGDNIEALITMGAH